MAPVMLLTRQFVWPTGQEFFDLLLIGIFGVLGQICLTYAYKLADASEVSIYSNTNILFAAALGFCSIVTAAASLIYGILALLEKEKNYRIAKVSTAIAGIEILIWLIIIVIAL